MVQVESEKIQQVTSGRPADGSSGTTSATLTTTRTRASRESIDIESRELKREQRPLDQTSSSEAWPTSGGGCGGYGYAASLAARDSSSPPLSLIDANVASLPLAPLTDKSHCQQPLPPQPATATAKTLSAGKLQAELTALAADKFSRLDRDRFLSKELDEVNNNSIQSFCHSQQQQQRQEQQEHPPPSRTDHRNHAQQSNQNQAAKLALSESIKQPQTQPISPLNLLTGLRMHANNLRSQQQHQQSNAKLSSNSSPNSYVESCLNPSEAQQDSGGGKVDSRLGNTRAPSSRGPLQGINIIPSYTSIFDKPRVSRQATESTPTSISAENNQQRQQTINTLTAETSTAASSRSPIRKQTTQFDSLSSSRTLLTTISSIGNKSGQRQEGSDLKKLPYEYSGARSRRPIDYDNHSHSQADFDLDAASSSGQSQTDPDEDEECELGVDNEKSPFRVEVISPEPRAKVATRNKLMNTADSRSDKRQESFRQSNKSSSSTTRIDRLMRPNVSASPSPGKKNTGSSGKRSQYPPAQQTRISMDDISRPPTFDSGQLQKQDQTKATSCRKLDLLEQVAHLDCDCLICLKNRKLASLHDHLYHHQSSIGLNGKSSKFNSSSSSKPLDDKYPKTRICHMVLKSIILVLCTLLLLMLLLSVVLLSVHLPKSMDNVMNASRSFNVTIAGRR